MVDGARPSRYASLVVMLAMVLATVVVQLPAAQAQGTCGGFQGFSAVGGNFQGGNFQGGFNNVGGFNFSGGGFQGGFQGSFGTGGLNFNGGLVGFGFNFGGRPGCNTGVFGLIPDALSIGPGETFAYRLVWVAPNSWHDLEYLDLRIRDDQTVLLIRWFEATNTFALVDPLTGQVLNSGAPLSGTVLRTPAIEVRLNGTYKEDSGPTGQAVGLNLDLAVSPTTEGRQFSVDVSAKLGAAAADPYEFAAVLYVASRAVKDNDDPKERRLTEEQRQQRERTNRAGLDEYRTEGNAVSSDCSAAIPTVTIANRDGLVVVQLLHDARDACETVRPGDYVEAVGEKQHEQLYEAHQLTVRRNGARVR